MRITVISPPWLPVPPPGYGGTELVLDGLCRGLQAAGHDVLLCTTGDSTCPVERHWTFERSLGTADTTSLSELRHVVAAYRAAIDWGADVVHDHTLAGPFHADRYPDLTVVTTNHGPFNDDLTPLFAAMTPRVPVIAISNHQASTAGEVAIAGVIHHGVDLGRFPMGAGAGGYAVSLGRMNPTKGIHTAALVARRVGMPLRIAAKMQEPAEVEYFDACVRPLLGADIEYVGEVGGADKARLLGDAVCLLNPIEWPEPFGMVMIEALACGTPVVTTPRGAAPEIVDDGVTGFLCRSEQALEVALAATGDLDRAACRRTVERRFSIERMAADHVELFEDLARPLAALVGSSVG